MWEEVAIGTVGGIVGAAIFPIAQRFFWVPGRPARFKRNVYRVWADHETFRGRRQRQLKKELLAIDEEVAERGLVGSGIQNKRKLEVARKCDEEIQDHRLLAVRQGEDAFHDLGTLERLWVTRIELRDDRDIPLAQRLIPPAERSTEDWD